MGIYDSFSYRPFDGGEVKEYASWDEYREIKMEEGIGYKEITILQKYKIKERDDRYDVYRLI